MNKNPDIATAREPQSNEPATKLEESLAEISQLIDKMEHSELTLEQSLQHFERGITLVRQCQKMLEEAEQKVQILVQNNQQEELSVYRMDTKDEGLPPDENAK